MTPAKPKKQKFVIEVVVETTDGIERTKKGIREMVAITLGHLTGFGVKVRVRKIDLD